MVEVIGWLPWLRKPKPVHIVLRGDLIGVEIALPVNQDALIELEGHTAIQGLRLRGGDSVTIHGGHFGASIEHPVALSFSGRERRQREMELQAIKRARRW